MLITPLGVVKVETLTTGLFVISIPGITNLYQWPKFVVWWNLNHWLTQETHKKMFLASPLEVLQTIDLCLRLSTTGTAWQPHISIRGAYIIMCLNGGNTSVLFHKTLVLGQWYIVNRDTRTLIKNSLEVEHFNNNTF